MCECYEYFSEGLEIWWTVRDFQSSLTTALLSSLQVGMVGENEDWVTVHQVSNEPEARSLEVPGLNPYTLYR